MKNKFVRFINFIKLHSNFFSYLMVLVIGIFFSLWLLKPGIIALPGQDTNFHLSRITGLSNSILNGDFYALIHDGLFGYGYANGMFYGNLLFYIPAVFHIWGGLSLINSYKVYILFCTIASSFTIFWCIKGITKSNKISLLGCFLYSGCLYKMCDFIVRSAAGEMGAFIFLPLIVLGLYYIIYGDYKKWWIFSIGFVGLIQCHIISSVIMFIICSIIISVNAGIFIKDKKRILYLFISAILILGLGASFIFPFLQGMIKNNLAVFQNNTYPWNDTISFEHLFLGIMYWGEDGTVPSLGVLFLIITIFRFKINKDQNDNIMKFCDICILVGIISLICITDIYPWKEFQLLNIIQIPWRLFLFSSLFLTVADAIILYYLFEKNRVNNIKIYIILIIIVGLIPYLTTEIHYRNNYEVEYDYTGYTIAVGEYLPAGTNTSLLSERGEIVTSNNDEITINFTKKGNRVNVEYSNNNSDDTYIEVPLLYYYGYYAEDDNGNQLLVTAGDNNVIRVYLTQEEGNVIVYYKGTKTQKYSIMLSILSLIILIIYLLRKKIKMLFKKTEKKYNVNL